MVNIKEYLKVGDRVTLRRLKDLCCEFETNRLGLPAIPYGCVVEMCENFGRKVVIERVLNQETFDIKGYRYDRSVFETCM